MPRGGKRARAGRKPGSIKFPGKQTKAGRLPEHLVTDETRLAINDIDSLLQAAGLNFQQLLEILKQRGSVANMLSYCKSPQKRLQPYRQHTLPVAASFDAVAISSDFDSLCDEFDIVEKIGHPDDTVFLTVRGDSMIDIGIQPGDELVVEVINYPIRIPNYGDLVIAQVNGKGTVKEFRSVNQKAYLIPYNTNVEIYEITSDDDFHVFGIVKGLYRTLHRQSKFAG